MSSASVAWPLDPPAVAHLTMRPGDGTLTVSAHADGSPAGGPFDLVLSASDLRAEARFDERRPERSLGSVTLDVGAVRVASLRRSAEPPSLARAAALGPTIRVEASEGVRSGAARFSFVAHLVRDGRAIPFLLDLSASIGDDGDVFVCGKGGASLAALGSPPLDLARRAFRVRDRVAVELALRLSPARAPLRVDPRRG